MAAIKDDLLRPASIDLWTVGRCGRIMSRRISTSTAPAVAYRCLPGRRTSKVVTAASTSKPSLAAAPAGESWGRRTSER